MWQKLNQQDSSTTSNYSMCAYNINAAIFEMAAVLYVLWFY